MIERKKTRRIYIGDVAIGDGAPVSVQSMTNTKTTDTEATVAQINALQAAGCDIVRLAVPDMEAALNLGNIIKKVNVPLVADIHFDYRLALEAIKQGKHGVLVLEKRFESLVHQLVQIGFKRLFATGLAGNFQYTAAPARLLVLVQRFLHCFAVQAAQVRQQCRSVLVCQPEIKHVRLRKRVGKR